MYQGSSENIIPMTMTFMLGELSIAPNAVSGRDPPFRNPIATGAAQFTHNPKGAPIRKPLKVLPSNPW